MLLVADLPLGLDARLGQRGDRRHEVALLPPPRGPAPHWRAQRSRKRIRQREGGRALVYAPGAARSASRGPPLLASPPAPRLFQRQAPRRRATWRRSFSAPPALDDRPGAAAVCTADHPQIAHGDPSRRRRGPRPAPRPMKKWPRPAAGSRLTASQATSRGDHLRLQLVLYAEIEIEGDENSAPNQAQATRRASRASGAQTPLAPPALSRGMINIANPDQDHDDPQDEVDEHCWTPSTATMRSMGRLHGPPVPEATVSGNPRAAGSAALPRPATSRGAEDVASRGATARAADVAGQPANSWKATRVGGRCGCSWSGRSGGARPPAGRCRRAGPR